MDPLEWMNETWMEHQRHGWRFRQRHKFCVCCLFKYVSMIAVIIWVKLGFLVDLLRCKFTARTSTRRAVDTGPFRCGFVGQVESPCTLHADSKEPVLDLIKVLWETCHSAGIVYSAFLEYDWLEKSRIARRMMWVMGCLTFWSHACCHQFSSAGLDPQCASVCVCV